MKITFYLMMENDNLLNPRFSVSPAAMNFIDRRPVWGGGNQIAFQLMVTQFRHLLNTVLCLRIPFHPETVDMKEP